MFALYHRLHAATIYLHMHEDKSAVATLWEFQERVGRVVGAPRARCEDAVQMLYLEAAFAIYFDNKTSIHKMYFNYIDNNECKCNLHLR